MNDKNHPEVLRPEQASELLKVSPTTLINWDREGKIKCIRTKGGHRRYLRSSILSAISNTPEPRKQRNICYCRVSSRDQKEDLERQASYFRNRFPEHEIIKDTGSGLNFKRKGFKTILESAIRGDIKEIVVTHRDRLCRFGFELIQQLIESNNGQIMVLDKKETSPNEELVNDLISIITVFSSRLYGLRSHSIKNQIKLQASKGFSNSDKDVEDEVISYD